MAEQEYKPPRTLREALLRERTELYQMRDTIHGAIMSLLAGEAVVSYTLQNRSCTKTRADLNSLKAFLKDLEGQIAEIEAVLSGRPQRQSTTNVYLNPQNVIPPFFWHGF